MIILPSDKGIIKYPYNRNLPTIRYNNADCQIMWNFNPYNCKNSGNIITTNNTAVTSWTSIGALTESMSSTGTTNPTWYSSRSEFNKKPAVYFNGSSDVLYLTSATQNAGLFAGANGVAIGVTFSLPNKPAANSLFFEYGGSGFPSSQQYYKITAGSTTIFHTASTNVTAFTSYNTNTSYSTFMANRNSVQCGFYINQTVSAPNTIFSYQGNNLYRYYPTIRIQPQTPIYVSQIVIYKYQASNTSTATLSATDYAAWYSYFKGLYGSVN